MNSAFIFFKGGGNLPAVAVPLVALGTQSGAIEIVDVSATAVATSFSVHNGVVRGLRWLGNSRLVSFSYTQVKDCILIIHLLSCAMSCFSCFVFAFFSYS